MAKRKVTVHTGASKTRAEIAQERYQKYGTFGAIANNGYETVSGVPAQQVITEMDERIAREAAKIWSG